MLLGLNFTAVIFVIFSAISCTKSRGAATTLPQRSHRVPPPSELETTSYW